jgi:broad specificity phosphatase PhoE
MASRVFRYLSHPQVNIDANVPVPEWGLSDVGRQRTLAVRHSPLLKATQLVVSSGERKALETASLIAEALGLVVLTLPESHENDRSATGFLPPTEFDSVANQFFDQPGRSVRGWERAIDAQKRIVDAARRAMAMSDSGDVLMVGHGGVGTLLYCHFRGLEISRRHDQQGGGGGNYWSLDLDTLNILQGWRSMEELAR